ncbi:MAG: DUF4292 domain-containing protein [Ignavibacteria bacterium]
MKKTVIVLLLLNLIFFPLLYTGCVPSKSAEMGEPLPSDRLIKKLEANRRKVKNFEGSGSLVINTEQLNTTVSFKVALQKPDSVYIEIYGPFGIDLAQVLVTNSNFSFYDIMNNVVYKGKSNSDVLKKIFKINLSFDDLMDAFTGAVNLTQRLSQEPDNYEIVYDKYVLTYIDAISGQMNKFTIGIRDLVITDYQLISSTDKLLIQIGYTKFKVQGGVSIPYSTDVQLKNDKQSMKIEYRKIEVNKQNIRVSMSIPEDVQVVEW